MSTKQTSTEIEKPTAKVSIRETITDSPLLPIDMIERLHAIDPSLVSRVFDLTETEGQYRRTETRRINTLTFSLRFIGQFAAFLLGFASIAGGVYLVYRGHEWAGVSIAGFGLTGLAVAFIKGREN